MQVTSSKVFLQNENVFQGFYSLIKTNNYTRAPENVKKLKATHTKYY